MSSHAPHKRHIQRNKSLEVAMYLLLVVHSYPPKNWFDLRKINKDVYLRTQLLV